MSLKISSLPKPIRTVALLASACLGVVTVGSTSALAAPNCVGTPSDTWLNITVDGVKSGEGQVAATLYADNSSKFLVKHGSMYVGRIPATAGETRLCLFVPKPGVYAIAVYHDQDGSGTINRGGLLGIPTEGFGFSNNPPTIASLPSFRSVRISIPRANLSTRIHLKYP